MHAMSSSYATEARMENKTSLNTYWTRKKGITLNRHREEFKLTTFMKLRGKWLEIKQEEKYLMFWYVDNNWLATQLWQHLP